jgi:hypothetical protein
LEPDMEGTSRNTKLDLDQGAVAVAEPEIVVDPERGDPRPGPSGYIRQELGVDGQDRVRGSRRG